MRIVLVVILSSVGLVAVGRQEKQTVTDSARPLKVMPQFANEPGWVWLDPPSEFRLGRNGGANEKILTTVYSVVDSKGVLQIFVAQAAVPGVLEAPSRVVLLDAAGKRYVPKREKAGGLANRDTALESSLSSLEPKVLTPDKIAYIGVERRVAQPPVAPEP
jgi:hypothetical protein